MTLARTALALALLASGQEGDPARMQYRGEPVAIADAPLIGAEIPDLAVVDLDGGAWTFSELAGPRGLVVVVRDSGCPVSRRYGPRLARLEKEYGSAGFGFLFVNPTPWETEAEARAEVGDYGFAAPYVLDSDARIARALRARTSTEIFVLDAARILVYRGAVDDQYGIGFTKPQPRRTLLRDALDAVAEGRVPDVPATIAPGCYLAYE